MGTLRFVVAAVLVSGLGLWIYVSYRHVDTVLRLRRSGLFDFPLLHPLFFVPIAGFAFAVWLLMKNRLVIAAAIAVLSLLLTTIYYLSQSAAGAGP